LVGFLIFTQIAITPQAGGPHDYSMIFPFPLLAFAFLAKSLYSHATTKTLQRVAAAVLGSAAMCIFLVNGHNTAAYLSHFRTNVHYNPRWSPEIYSLSEYVNKHGFEANRIISADWGLHNQLHACAQQTSAADAGFVAPIQAAWSKDSTGAKRNAAAHFSRG